MKNTLFALLLLSATFAMGQGSVLSGGPIVANPLGQPLPGVTVAVCTSDPGTPTTGGCPGHLATLYTDVTVGTACTGTTPIQPLSNPGGAGTGCSNPGTVDGRGNAVAFAHAGQYWCEYYGTGLNGVAVQPCMFPGTAAGTAPITITCSGTDKLSAYNATTGAFTCSAVAGGGVPASPDTSVQFNDGGAFGGSSALLFAKDNTVGGSGQLEMQSVDQGLTKGAALWVSASDSNGAAAGSYAAANFLSFNAAPAAAGVVSSFDAIRATFGNSADGTVTSAAGIHIGPAANVGGGVITSNTGVLIDAQTAGTSNYGIKIGDIGTSSANDFAMRTGWGKSVFGGDADDPITIWASDTEWGSNSTLHIPVGDTFILGTKSNNHTDSHVLMSANINSPAVVLSSTSGSGAIPTIDLYGNTNHTYIDSGIFTIVNNSGIASTITTNNTGGDFPATGNSNGLQITATGSGGGAYFGNALEVTGLGSDYEHSFGIQVQSASRAVFTGGAQIKTTSSQPTCDAEIRGTFWDLQGAAGVADVIQVCMKDAANAYAWHTVTIP